MNYSYWKAWRRKHPEYRNRSRKRFYQKTAHSRNCRQPWTMTELGLVMAHKVTDTILSELLGRSVGSIQVQRAYHKREERLRPEIRVIKEVSHDER